MIINTELMSDEETALNFVERKCDQFGLRRTRSLKIVLGILVNSNEDLTISQIHTLGCYTKDSLALTTVYRMIKKLVKFGLVECYQFKLNQCSYKLKSIDPHDHLINLGSGKIVEFSSHTLEKLKQEISEEFGCQKLDCRVEVYIHPLEAVARTSL